jgi:hypothetical protein
MASKPAAEKPDVGDILLAIRESRTFSQISRPFVQHSVSINVTTAAASVDERGQLFLYPVISLQN